MSPRARTTAPKRSGSTTRRASTAKRGKGHTALDRLTKSVDSAQDALKDLRGEMKGELQSCVGRRVTDGIMDCVRVAKTTDEISQCMR